MQDSSEKTTSVLNDAYCEYASLGMSGIIIIISCSNYKLRKLHILSRNIGSFLAVPPLAFIQDYGLEQPQMFAGNVLI